MCFAEAFHISRMFGFWHGKMLVGLSSWNTGVAFLDGVHLRDVGGQVNVGLFPVRRGGMDDVQGLAEAEFEAHRHHDAGGEEGGEEVALLEPGEVAVQFLAEAGRVVALREADRAGGLAHEVVLLDQPPILEVPPLGAVEDVIEAGAGGVARLVGGAAERFGDETGVGMARL